MSIIFTYSGWFLLLCILCGAVFAGVLYFRDKKLHSLSKNAIIGLGILRFIAVALIAFLLLEPLFETVKTTTEKPIVVLAQDNSESIIFNSDSTNIKTTYLANLNALEEQLEQKYEVVRYRFGFDLKQTDSVSFNDKETNLALAIKQLNERYYNRNLGAIVIASDGIFNKGNNPFYEAKRLKNIPIYSIALGDTTPVKDVLIDQIINNRLAYQGNNFPIEVAIKSSGVNNQQTVVKVIKNGNLIRQTNIQLSTQNKFQTVRFELEATTAGIQEYTVLVVPINGEYTTANNQKSFYIDVLKSKQKILLLGNAPHPDIAAFKRSIETNDNYEVTAKLMSDFDNKIKDYNLVVLHNLPSGKNQMTSLIGQLNAIKTPILFVLGTQTSYNNFNSLKKGLTLSFGNSFSDAQGAVNNNFSLFKINPNLNQSIGKLPPIKVPFSRSFKLVNSTEVLFYQKVGLTKTNYPLVAFNKQQGNKTGFIFGEGYYKWKYYDFLEHKNNDLFNEFVTKSVQYLVSKENKSQFKVFSDNNFTENTPLFFEAEVYNKSYELINTNDVTIKVKNDKGEEFPFNFSKTSNRYELDAGLFSSGKYTYTAQTLINGKKEERVGEFSVTELKAEQTNSVANHQLLFSLSDVTNGKMYYPNQLDELAKEVSDREDLVGVIYTKNDVDDIINLKYLFFFILLLLGAEWFIRKRNGGY